MTAEKLLELVDRINFDVSLLREKFPGVDLRELRGERSQETIAARAEVSQATISKLETGNLRGVGNAALLRVLKAYLEAQPCSSV